MVSQFGVKLREKLEELALSESELSKRYVKGPCPIIGCSPEEIEEVKTCQQVDRLPEIYIQFLQVAGRACGDIFIGATLHYPVLKNLKQYAISILHEEHPHLSLPDDAFVFVDEQGVCFWYFHTDNQDDDPPVYMYSQWGGYDEEDNPYKAGPILKYDNLSYFLTLFIGHREGKEAQEEFLAKYT